MAVEIIVMVLVSAIALFVLTRKNVIVTPRAGCWMWFIIIMTVLILLGLFIGMFS